MEQLFLTGHVFDHLTTQTANIVFKMTLFIVIKNVLKDGLFFQILHAAFIYIAFSKKNNTARSLHYIHFTVLTFPIWV